MKSPLASAFAGTFAISALMLGGTALAGSYTPPAPTPAPIAPVSLAHDWTGWYGDVYAGHWMTSGPGNFVGADLGFNTSNGAMIYGGELGIIHDPSLALTGFSIAGRVGAAAGANTLLFARIGIDSYNVAVPSTSNFEYGIGVQYAVTDSMYLRGDALMLTPTGGGASGSQVRLGLGWEF